MNKIFMTPVEKARKEKHAKICAMFLDLSNKNPDVFPHRIFDAIARSFGMTTPGVKNIIIKNGLYKTR